MDLNLLGFVCVVLVAYLIPGPDFMVVSQSATRSRIAGVLAGMGAQTGLCIHMVAAAVGLAALAAHSAYAFMIIKYAGAAYVFWLGAKTLFTNARRPYRGDVTPPERGVYAGTQPRRLWVAFTTGLFTNLLNPKAALFFLSILPQFYDHSASATPQILTLGLLDIVIGVVYWLLVVYLVDAIRGFLNRPLINAWWNRLTGLALIAFGIGLVRESPR